MIFKAYRLSLKSGPFPQRASNLVDYKTFAKKKGRLWGRRHLSPFGREKDILNFCSNLHAALESGTCLRGRPGIGEYLQGAH